MKCLQSSLGTLAQGNNEGDMQKPISKSILQYAQNLSNHNVIILGGWWEYKKPYYQRLKHTAFSGQSSSISYTQWRNLSSVEQLYCTAC